MNIEGCTVYHNSNNGIVKIIILKSKTHKYIKIVLFSEFLYKYIHMYLHFFFNSCIGPYILFSYMLSLKGLICSTTVSNIISLM